jgi:hypothetical protein
VLRRVDHLMRAFLLVLVIAAGAGPFVDSSSARSRPICGPKSAKTVKKTDRLRVFRSGEDQVVCSRYSRRTWKLNPPPFQPECDNSSQGCYGRTGLVVAGRWVAQVMQHVGGGAGSNGYVILRAAGTSRAAASYSVESASYIMDTQLDRRGSVAWIEGRASAEPFDWTYRVRRAGGCDPTTLDEGKEIVRNSLRIRASAIEWQNATDARSAPACPRNG